MQPVNALFFSKSKPLRFQHQVNVVVPPRSKSLFSFFIVHREYSIVSSFLDPQPKGYGLNSRVFSTPNRSTGLVHSS